MKCAACGLEGEFRVIAAMSEDRSEEEETDIRIYSPITLYACPECGTVRVENASIHNTETPKV